MWLRNPLDSVLASRSRVGILRVLATSAAPLSGREIGRRAAVAPGHVSRALRDLVAAGIVRGHDHGRVKTYELADDDSELVAGVRRLFATERQRRQTVLDELMASTPDLLTIVLFGSEARAEATPASDTDLLLVVKHRTEPLEARLRDVCLRLAEAHSLALSWHIADLNDLRQWDTEGHELWLNILREGLRLRGTPLEELRRVWQPGRTTWSSPGVSGT